ncbi:hypothetical protein BKA62DRAFT_683000 [Auriculariales sp. MPI-PUGE-AT-0066]|nr:hypothetical protein BKA62DRAFT_683000 [Auriculariales sp. MPI-PUGE-AT-0066]
MASCDLLSLVLERCPRQICIPTWASPAFNGGLILVVRFFGFKQTLTKVEVDDTLRGIRTCIDTLALIMRTSKATAERWEALNELASGLGQPLPPSKVSENILPPLVTTTANYHPKTAPAALEPLHSRFIYADAASVVIPPVGVVSTSAGFHQPTPEVPGLFMVEQLPPILQDQLLRMYSAGTVWGADSI